MNQPRILILEPSAIVSEGLKTLLQRSHQVEVLPPVCEVENLPELLRSEKPEMLVANPLVLTQGRKNQLHVLRQEFPDLVTVALVYEYVEPALRRQFQGELDIRENSETLVPLLLSLLDSAPSASPAEYELSERELEVLRLVAKGLTNKEIADNLSLSVHTVMSHRKNITRKTGIRSVAGLTVFAMMKGL